VVVAEMRRQGFNDDDIGKSQAATIAGFSMQ